MEDMERILLLPEEIQTLSPAELTQVHECLRNPAVRKYLRHLMTMSVSDFLENTVISETDKEKLACRVLILQGIRKVISVLINLPPVPIKPQEGAKK